LNNPSTFRLKKDGFDEAKGKDIFPLPFYFFSSPPEWKPFIIITRQQRN